MMQAIALLIISVMISLPLAAQDSSKTTGDGKTVDKSTGKPSTLKLYDVPSPLEAGDRSPEEVADYVAITKAADAKAQVELIEAFIKKYPKSQYVPSLHQVAVSDYQLIGEPIKLIEHGEKVLEIAPQNPPILAILAVTYAARGDSEKAIERGTKAVAILDKVEPAPKADPEQFTHQKNRLLSIAYAGLGTAYLDRFEKARVVELASQSKPEAKPATSETSAPSPPQNPASGKEAPVPSGASTEKPSAPSGTPDPLDLSKAKGYFARALELDAGYEFAQFQMGVAYAQEKQVAQSLESFAKVMAMQGALSNPAKQNFERIYKLTHNNSLAGSEELLEKAKAAWAEQKPAPKPPKPAE